MVAWLKRNWWEVTFFGGCGLVLAVGVCLFVSLEGELKDRAAAYSAVVATGALLATLLKQAHDSREKANDREKKEVVTVRKVYKVRTPFRLGLMVELYNGGSSEVPIEGVVLRSTSHQPPMEKRLPTYGPNEEQPFDMSRWSGEMMERCVLRPKDFALYFFQIGWRELFELTNGGADKVELSVASFSGVLAEHSGGELEAILAELVRMSPVKPPDK